MSENQNKIAFLVGAGLVKDAGLPLSVHLVTKLKESLNEVSNNIDEGEEGRKLARAQLAALHFINGAIRFQKGVLDGDPDDPINIEDIAVAAIELQSRMKNPLAPYASGWHERIVELERQNPDVLATFIEFIYSRLKTWLTFHKLEDISYLTKFRDFCLNDEGIDIFSLNYDLCIESALRDIVEAVFENGFTADGWRPANFYNGRTIRLFKLHGSLDWVEDTAYGLCSLEFPRHKDAEDVEDAGHRPLLIFGTSHKLSPKEPFLSLAYQFSQSILKSPILIIIGYSFGDDYINEIIRQGLWANTRLKIVIVSPNAEAQVLESELLTKNPRVKTMPKGAKQALEDGSLLIQVRGIVKELEHEEPF
jgi:hypothetical protein